MKREFLEGFGLDKEAIDKIMEENGQDIEKAKGNRATLESENESLKSQLKEHESQLQSLKESQGDNKALKDQIEALQKANEDKKAEYEASLQNKDKTYAVSLALEKARARNQKAFNGLIDYDKITWEDGTVKGVDEQIEALKASDPYLFGELKPQGTPPASGDRSLQKGIGEQMAEVVNTSSQKLDW